MRMPFLVAAVDRALQRDAPLAGGASIVVGLSGGADSVALTDALSALRRRRGFRLVAAHLDHGLRPGSADDASFCAALCEQLGVPFRGGKAKVRARAAREKGGLEQAARRERYAFLRRVKLDESAAVIAVAHTQDDQAETLLLRLLRGAGAGGLAAMRSLSGDVWRPLLTLSRAQVLEHLRGRGLAWREDPSNADLAHLRNRVRHELVPYLAERFNPRVREALASTAELLADEARYIGAQAEELLATIGRREGDTLVIDRARLAAAPPAVARSALRLALDQIGGLAGVDRGHVEAVLRLCAAAAPGGRRIWLPGVRECRFTHRTLRLGKRATSATKAVSSSRTKP